MRGVYDEAKRFAEAMTMAYHRDHGVNTHIVRIFNTYGERMRLDDGRVLPNFMGQALRGEPITVYGDGQQTRSFCYVSDLVEGIFRLLFTDFHDPVNLGNPAEITILEFAEEILQAGRAARARSSTGRCRRTTRRCASRTSPAPGSCSAGSRRSAATRGCGGRWSTSASRSRGREGRRAFGIGRASRVSGMRIRESPATGPKGESSSRSRGTLARFGRRARRAG